MWQGIDLASDTATRPSSAMKQAMMEASLGDEQRGEDPTTKKLEDRMAEMLNKSSAMFFPSATMCNQIAVKLFTKPGQEILGSDDCHMFNSEAGALGFHSGVQPRAIKTATGIFGSDDIKKSMRYVIGPHTPRTSMLLVENTTNAGGGYAWPLSLLEEVLSTAKSLDFKTHLDGSRLFNAAAATKIDVGVLAKGFDSVTICFSKGLGCAAGAILAFDNVGREEVRRLKQIFGGSLRQSGMLAAACLFSLDHHVPELTLDHRRAQTLAIGLTRIQNIIVENAKPETNIVFFSVNSEKMDPELFIKTCGMRGLRFSRFNKNRFRAVTHRDIKDSDIDECVKIVGEILK